MQSEMDAVEKNRTWELADLPRGHRAITLKWVFKLKRDEAGTVVKHKARLVARGFVQQEGVDFDDAFAPVARMESVRLLLALAAQEGWRVHHMDVKSAFLNGDLKEEVYVHQPPGFAIPGKEGKVLRLRKALYGLRQAPRAWNAKLDSTLKGMGFEQSPHEAAIYRRGKGGNALLVGVYVDDLVITGTKDAEVVAFKEEMKATFQMSDLGPLSFYLGIEVHQDDSGITLRQTAYAKRVVELAGLTDCNPALTPMEERLKLSRDSTAEEVDAVPTPCGEPPLPRPHTAGLGVLRRLRQSVHAATDDGAPAGREEDHPLCCGDSRPRSPLPEVPWSGTLRRVQRQRPRRRHRHQQEHERDPLLPRRVPC